MVEWHHRLNGHEFEYHQQELVTERPGMLQSMGSQRVRQDSATELNYLNYESRDRSL